MNPECPNAGKIVEKMKREEQVMKIEVPPEPACDPLEQKGLDELVRFINGSSLEEQKKSSKAAKRARQKLRKVRLIMTNCKDFLHKSGVVFTKILKTILCLKSKNYS